MLSVTRNLPWRATESNSDSIVTLSGDVEQKAQYDVSLSAAMTTQELWEKRANLHDFVIEYFQTDDSISCG